MNRYPSSDYDYDERGYVMHPVYGRVDPYDLPAIEWSDCLMEQKTTICYEQPQEARAAHRKAYDRLQELRNKAMYPGAVCYGRDRVQSSNQRDLSDTVAAIEDAERELWIANLCCIAAEATIRSVCAAAGFSSFYTRVWVLHYAYGKSMAEIAVFLNTYKSRVQYITTGRSPIRNFMFGIERIAPDAIDD